MNCVDITMTSKVNCKCTMGCSVKGSSVKSKKVETIKNKFSVILDCEFESFKYRVYFNNYLIAVCCTKEEAIEYINKVKKNCEGMKPNGAIYEEYIS